MTRLECGAHPDRSVLEQLTPERPSRGWPETPQGMVAALRRAGPPLRVRAGHSHAALPNLWIGRNGAMTPSGVFQVVSERAPRSACLACIPISFALVRGLVAGRRRH